jgi:hypothetical protein
MALLQQLQIEQAFADIWDFTLHVVSYQAERQLVRSGEISILSFFDLGKVCTVVT